MYLREFIILFANIQEGQIILLTIKYPASEGSRLQRVHYCIGTAALGPNARRLSVCIV
jgi:hypothetical protein